MKKHSKHDRAKAEMEQSQTADDNLTDSPETTGEAPQNDEGKAPETKEENAENSAAPDEAGEALQERLEGEEKARREAEERCLRLAAEFDNFRKRSRREKDQIYANAKSDVVKSILPILDSLDRALETAPESSRSDVKAVLDGLELVRRQALDCLAGIGVEVMKAEGECFNPEFHDAIQHIEDDKLAENCIVKAVLKGYKIGDNVIRHAAVIVAN